jgi:RNA polymerase sigma-70 factor (ECF subfamily)
MSSMQPDDNGRAAPTDEELMVRVVARDQSAFAAVYDRHARVVYGSVVRYLGDPATAEDVTQEAFLAVWQRAEMFNPAAGKLLGWLLGIARNKAIDRTRAAARRPRLVEWTRPDSPDDSEPHASSTSSTGSGDEHADPEAAVARRWVQSVVRTALATMTPQERRVLELAYDEGLSQSEVAERLGWPLGTVKSRTRRALAVLREVLAGVPDLVDTVGRGPWAAGVREGS